MCFRDIKRACLVLEQKCFFFSFPNDKERREKWILAMRRKNFKPGQGSYICSKHFLEADFDRNVQTSVRLFRSAVPSVFSGFPSYYQKQPVRSRPLPSRSKIAIVSSPVSPVEDVTATAGIDPPGSYSIPVQESTPAVTVMPTSPGKIKLKRALEESEMKLEVYRKKIKILHQCKRRLVKKNNDLKDILAELRKKNLMSDASLDVIETSAGGISDLLKRKIAKKTGIPLPKCYSPRLRSFALTLHFYSPKAYSYVRRTFDTCLPHPRTLEKWYQSINGEPGFTEEAFNALRQKVNAALQEGKPSPCALVMDEMAIKQYTEFDGEKMHGYVDMGTGIQDDSLPIAREALVFMVVSLNESWKLPVGYFLIDGLAAQERKTLVQQCVTKLHSCGLSVESLTFDGASSNVAMAKELGCKMGLDDLAPFFSHPVTGKPVHIFLDPCHMLKLVRNTVGDKKLIVDGDGHVIKWDYIETLHKLQSSTGIHLANKVRNAHLNYFRKKMNVKLAAQLLSDSVADSLQFCLDNNIDGFAGCEATIKFIRVFNRVFDILNSRNLSSFGYKRPLNESNAKEIFTKVDEDAVYIKSLRCHPTGQQICLSNRRTGFHGFLVCLVSLRNLYDSIRKLGMSFLLTYKISQDHIELFFGKIRSQGGCNNNPTSRQFQSAYKRMFVHNDLKDVMRGNCIALESVPILTATSKVNSCASIANSFILNLNNSCPRYRIMNHQPNFDWDCFDPSDPCCADYFKDQSLYYKNVVAYISGFIVKKLLKNLHCDTCVAALTSTDNNANHNFINLKSKGGLITPSQDVIDVCLSAENQFRLHVATDCTTVRLHPIIKLVHLVLNSFVHSNVFSSLTLHALECSPLHNHVCLLIKCIAAKYLQLRYFHAAKNYSSNVQHQKNTKSRQNASKLIIFNGL